MALPVTITGIDTPFHGGRLGPVKSSGNNFYAFGKGDGTADEQFRAFKATDPTDSFAEQDTSNRPVLAAAADAIDSLSSVQDGDDAHCVGQGENDDVVYCRFDMSSDVWANIDGAGDRDIEIEPASIDTINAQNADIGVRGDGDIVVVYQGHRTKFMGTDRPSVHYAVSTDSGQTWNAGNVIDGEGANGYTCPRIVIGDSDAAHICYKRDPDSGSDELMQRTLNSSDALQTERGVSTDVLASNYPIGYGVSFSRSSTTRIRFPLADSAQDAAALEFDSAADPSPSAPAQVDTTGAVDVPSGNYSVIHGAVDGTTYHVLWSENLDNDLEHEDDGGSDDWSGSPTTEKTGTYTFLSTDIYTRGGDTKIGLIVLNGSNVQYDEHDLGAAPAGGLPPNSLALTGVGV